MHLPCLGSDELGFFLKISLLDTVFADGLSGQASSQCSIGNETRWEWVQTRSLLVRPLGEEKPDFPGKQGEAEKEQTQADPGRGLSGN